MVAKAGEDAIYFCTTRSVVRLDDAGFKALKKPRSYYCKTTTTNR